MKIHQIAPPYIPVDPSITYGGIERVMYQLDRALVRLGHTTSMSAPKGSKPAGRLHETVLPVGIGDGRKFSEQDAFYLKLDSLEMSIAYANEGDFDVVHSHEENLLPFLGHINKPVVYTIHSTPEEFWNHEIHREIIAFQHRKNLVAVSGRIRDIYNEMGFDIRHVVHNGFDIDSRYFSEDKLDYLLILGVVLPKKGQDIAIEVAERLKKPLVIAGNIGNPDYFDAMRPKITHSVSEADDKLNAYKNLPSGMKIVYAGHVNDEQKFPLFAHAHAVLVPSVVEDPLPGVVIEAMACGTPVIGFNKGGIPEMVVHGRNGYVVGDIDEMTDMVGEAHRINPFDCLADYTFHFTSAAMAERYLNVYSEVIKNG